MEGVGWQSQTSKAASLLGDPAADSREECQRLGPLVSKRRVVTEEQGGAKTWGVGFDEKKGLRVEAPKAPPRLFFLPSGR